MAKELQEEDCYVALTHDHLDAKTTMDRVRSPKAGAIVLFAGNEIQSPSKRLANKIKVQLETTLVEN